MKRMIPLAAVLLLAGADQGIKALVLRWQERRPGEIRSLIPGLLRLQYTENTGAIFGVFDKSTVALAVISLAVVIAGAVLLLTGKIKGGVQVTCTVLILAGGLGNLIDRAARRYVVDYLEFPFTAFAIFNFADVMVTVGIAGMIAYLIWDMIRDARKPKPEKAS
ncbi:MAG: signal peptidase II [Oscillospiraceae bacterium]|jgi:signal peptidase II|nr:signal peptidase II [Oscillospiraceae bacterium]